MKTKLEEKEATPEEKELKSVEKDMAQNYSTDELITGENEKVKNDSVVYCGPSIKGVAQQFTTYTNGLPKKLKQYSESNNSFKRLIVPINRLVETKKNILIQGTIENLSFNKIQKGE
jgi:hypothetical protein